MTRQLHLTGVALMITAIVRLAQAVEDTKRAHAEIEAEELFGHLNRFNQSKALQYAALAEQFAALSVKHLQKINVNRKVSASFSAREHKGLEKSSQPERRPRHTGHNCERTQLMRTREQSAAVWAVKSAGK
jgi:hypothetical protein